MAQKPKSDMGRVENILRKGENAGSQHSVLFQCLSKGGIVSYRYIVSEIQESHQHKIYLPTRTASFTCICFAFKSFVPLKT